MSVSGQDERTWGRVGRVVGAVLGLALAGAAGACDMQSGLDLHYRATQEGRGGLWVRVSCRPADPPYRLRLVGGGDAGTGDMGTAARDLRVGLRSERGADVLGAALLNVWPTLGNLARDGEVLSGSRTLNFELRVPAGQWVTGGAYTLPLTVVLEPVGAP